MSRGMTDEEPEAIPPLKNDAEAEEFLAQDLSEIDFSQFKPVRFEFVSEDEQGD